MSDRERLTDVFEVVLATHPDDDLGGSAGRRELAELLAVRAVEVLTDPGSEVQACGCGGEGCDTCGASYLMIVAGQGVSEGPADEHQEHGETGAGLQK